MAPKFPWSPPLEHQLILAILVKKGHIAEKSRVTEVWRDIYETLFSQELFAPLKPHYYDPRDGGGVRVFRARFDLLLKMMDTADRSRYKGELGTMFSNLNVIKDERDKEHHKSISKKERVTEIQQKEQIEEQIVEKSIVCMVWS